MWRPFLSVAIGVILGLAGARYQQLGLWTLVPWVVAGLLIGGFPPRKRALVSGAVFGFALAFSFMIAAYTGVAPVRTRLPAFAVLGVVGALCGIVLALAGLYRRAPAPILRSQR